MRLSEPATKKKFEQRYSYYQKEKYSPITLLSGNVSLCGYSRDSLGRRCQTTVGLSTTAIFSVFAGYFLRNFRNKATVQHYYITMRTPSLAFQWSQNTWSWVTLNGYFALNSVLPPFCLGSDNAILENNCVKTNKGTRPIPGANLQQWLWVLVIDMRFMRIFAGIL